ncbi:FCSD flavin-binding domain-containing protein [Methylomonas sp. MgM2]
MTLPSRRRFLKALAGSAAWSLSACQSLPRKSAKARVVVVGGGFGGATAAKTLCLLDVNVHVTLIDPVTRYMTCPGSNWLFAGLINPDRLMVEYRALKDRYGIDVRNDRVSAIDRSRRQLRLASGQFLAYDRLILSPGIAFRWDAIDGYSSAVAEIFPHAWRAGPQTFLLIKQLQSMPDGGVIIIAAPPDPYRCPPGPYERASMMAYWLQRHKPRSKIIILDPKRSFSKQALFEAAWAKHYGYGTRNSLIEWQSLADNPIIRLEKNSKTLITDFGDRFRADVLNIIPPQKAAELAGQADLTDSSGWCPVRPQTGQSMFDEFIHVIGDAANYAPLPKSAFAANSAAKACAIAVIALLNDQIVEDPNWMNTCYSLITPTHGISIAGVYKLDPGNNIAAVKGAGGTSPVSIPSFAEREARYAKSAYQALVSNTFL